MPQRNPEARCGTCPYWHSDKQQCRREPAKLFTGFIDKYDEENKNHWPNSFARAWCGEHPDFWLPDTVPEGATHANT